MARRASDLLIAAAIAAVAGAAAVAQTPARVEVERIGETARVRLIYPERLGGEVGAEAEIAAGAVVVASLAEAAAFDAQIIADAAPDLVARGRLDPDGRTLRLALIGPAEARVSVSHNIIALDLAPPGTAPLDPVVSPFEREQAEARRVAAARAAEQAAAAAEGPPPLPVSLRFGEAAEYSRIRLSWPEPVTWTVQREGERADIVFSRRFTTQAADLAELSLDPPRGVFEAGRPQADGDALRLQLAPGFDVRVWSEGPEVTIDVFDPASGGVLDTLAALEAYADAREAQAAAQADAETAATEEAPDAAPARAEIARPDPVPENGVVALAARTDGADAILSFPWANLPGAAVFRRAESIWIVFDAAADIDTAELAGVGRRHVEGARALRGPDWTALRIEAPASTQASVRAEGPVWTVRLSERLDEPPRPVRIQRETGFNQPAALRFEAPGARSVRRLDDPVVGDQLVVVTADGESRGVVAERRFLETLVLRSSHGVPLAPLADDLDVRTEPGGAVLTRPGGLALSRAADPAMAGRVAQPVSPAFLDLEAWRGGSRYLPAMHRARSRARLGDADSLMDLARFYLGWELAPEAIGAIDLAVEARPALDDTAEVKAMRGAAAAMLERMEEAEAIFSDIEIAADPVVQPWRGYVAASLGDFAEARRRFEAGAASVFFYAPEWRARFRAANARAALELNDLGAAAELLSRLESDEPDSPTRAEAELLQARLAAIAGDPDGARMRLSQLVRSDYEPIQARAILEQLRLDLDQERITISEAADALEALRFRWRGDDSELEATRLLGNWYAQAGRYARAFETMSAAEVRYAGTPLGRAIGTDMRALFRRLYLDGEADRLDPIEAIALFREYSYLTPQGPDGDRMVRRFVDRLVDVDLLDDAATLLSHQIDERSMPAQARARVATDLAVIHLMAGRDREALQVLANTRVAGLPRPLVLERRLLEARARYGLDLYDHALELIEGDESAEAARLRVDIAWARRDWPRVGRQLESLLGDRWRSEDALNARETHDVLRAGIAYALAGDRQSVERLGARYGAMMSATPHAAAFSLVTGSALAAGDSRLIDLVGRLSSMEGADAFMTGFADRFSDGVDAAGGS